MTKGKRILYYTGSLASGGAERQLIYTALSAEQRGYNVKIIVDYPFCHYEHMFEGSGIEVLCTNTTGYTPIKRFFLLSKVMREFKPEIVHSFLGMRNFWAMTLSKVFGVPLKIASIRSTYAAGFTGLSLYRFLADYIICNSRLAANTAIKKYGVRKDKIIVHYNAIDFIRFHDAIPLSTLKGELGLDESVRLGVTLARLDKEKNIPGLISALKLLDNEKILNDIHFLIVGKKTDVSLEKIVEEQILTYGLSEKVTLLGFRQDIPEILKACDFMVLPSFSEGFPNVVLEAMAAGVFVIATPTGGTTELVKDRKNGLLTKGTKPKDLAESIKIFMQMQKIEEATIRKKAINCARKYSLDHIFDRLFLLYEGSTDIVTDEHKWF